MGMLWIVVVIVIVIVIVILIAIRIEEEDSLMRGKLLILLFLIFIFLFFNRVFALTVDFSILAPESNFVHSLRGDAYYRVFYLGQGGEGNGTFLLMFTNVDFENNRRCENLCVYVIAKTRRDSMTFFYRTRKSVLNFPGYSFDVVKQSTNRFYLFSLVKPGLLRVYEVSFNFPSHASKGKASLTVDYLQDLHIPEPKGTTKCNQYIMTPHVFPGGNSDPVLVIENDCKLSNQGKVFYDLYRFHPKENKISFLTSYDPGEYEVFGNSFYLFDDNLLVVLFDGEKLWRLQSNKCSIDLNGNPFFLSYDWKTKNVLFFVSGYFPSVDDCTSYFYPLSPEFTKLISFCPNINLMRKMLYMQTFQSSGLYSLDIRNCVLRKQEDGTLFSKVLKTENLFLSNVKFIKPFIEHKEDVYIFEYNWQGVYRLGFVE
ncbi:MAG: hypothetical protein QXR39_08705 [Candidatus Methanomethylicia archaeon]